MSVLDWLLQKLIGTDTKGLYKVGRAVNDAVRPDPVIKPFGRPHAWRVGLEDPPRCGLGCGHVRTEQNAEDMCPGPLPRSR